MIHINNKLAVVKASPPLAKAQGSAKQPAPIIALAQLATAAESVILLPESAGSELGGKAAPSAAALNFECSPIRLVVLLFVLLGSSSCMFLRRAFRLVAEREEPKPLCFLSNFAVFEDFLEKLPWQTLAFLAIVWFILANRVLS